MLVTLTTGYKSVSHILYFPLPHTHNSRSLVFAMCVTASLHGFTRVCHASTSAVCHLRITCKCTPRTQVIFLVRESAYWFLLQSPVLHYKCTTLCVELSSLPFTGCPWFLHGNYRTHRTVVGIIKLMYSIQSISLGNL